MNALEMAPLLEWARQRYVPESKYAPDVAGASHLAAITGIDRRYIYRLNERGLSWYQADAIAIRLGVHPSEIWLDWFDQQADVKWYDPEWPPQVVAA